MINPDFESRDTPGVYTTEFSAFPPSVVGVETAVPCFIGYTETAHDNGTDVTLSPVAISSLADYEAVFGGAFESAYTIGDVADPASGYDLHIDDPQAGSRYFNLIGNGQFNLYNSVQLFYANGGAQAYLVSVGPYASEGSGSPIVSTVSSKDLLAGLDAAGKQAGPSMLVIPDAVLLSGSGTQPSGSADFAQVAQAMIAQAAALQDRIAVLDVYGTGLLSQPGSGATLDSVIDAFRAAVGSDGLSFGAAYFPFLQTTVVSPAEVSYLRFASDPADGGGTGRLQQVLSWANQAANGDPSDPANARGREVQASIDAIATTDPADATAVASLNAVLSSALPAMAQMQQIVAEREGTLPPSGAMAGVMTATDAQLGVWNAPANVPLVGVTQPTVALSNTQQADLNAPLDGKAVNAIRAFADRGTVAWGARTLDGNSNDYRYIQVRRTLIYIEQSIKNALQPFEFAGNNGQTWATVVALVSTFLQGIWSQGGLMGDTASSAFRVQCGVGSTMTGEDVANGYMIVQVGLQMIHPAEFIVLQFTQTMQGV